MIMQPGPELDAKVAAACGIKGSSDGRGFVFNESESGLTFSHNGYWRPSTDLNAAFDAAEKCGLFVVRPASLSFEPAAFGRSQEWRLSAMVMRDEEDGDNVEGEWFIAGRGPTVALAICAAILAVKGVSAKA